MATRAREQQITFERMIDETSMVDPTLLIVDHDRFHASDPPSGRVIAARWNGGLNHGSIRQRTNAATRRRSRPVTIDRVRADGRRILTLEMTRIGEDERKAARRRCDWQVETSENSGVANDDGSNHRSDTAASKRRPALPSSGGKRWTLPSGIKFEGTGESHDK
jgi:hypothetical protein